MHGIAAIRLHTGGDDQVFMSAESRGQRPFHILRILRVDIIVDDNDELEQVHLADGKQHGTLAFA